MVKLGDGELAGAAVVVSDDGAGTSTGDGDCGAGGIDELGDGDLAGAAVVVVSDDDELGAVDELGDGVNELGELSCDGLGEPT